MAHLIVGGIMGAALASYVWGFSYIRVKDENKFLRVKLRLHGQKVVRKSPTSK